MESEIRDHKNLMLFKPLNWINTALVRSRFSEVQVLGDENVPKSGPFLLVANHSSRWDGLVIGHLLNRPANYMVTPNELKGFQGTMLRKAGGFPADRRLNLINFVREQVKKGEPVVIFPEGDIHRDGVTHPFKRGAARIVLDCLKYGINLPVVTVGIRYHRKSVSLAVLEPSCVLNQPGFVSSMDKDFSEQLSQCMHERVCEAKLLLQMDRSIRLRSDLQQAS